MFWGVISGEFARDSVSTKVKRISVELKDESSKPGIELMMVVCGRQTLTYEILMVNIDAIKVVEMGCCGVGDN